MTNNPREADAEHYFGLALVGCWGGVLRGLWDNPTMSLFSIIAMMTILGLRVSAREASKAAHRFPRSTDAKPR